MNNKRLKQIEELYHAALEIAPVEREEFLDESCADDEDLRREVESLLAVNRTSNNLFDTPPESLAAEMFFERKEQANLTGKKISHYKIKKLLGKGGMGEVYLADDINLNRQVALKFLPAELIGNADRLKRFEQEAQSASALNHPNILTIHQFGTEAGSRFIVMEFVRGLTLREKLASGRLTVSKTLDVAVQVASALAEAHEAGIIHRDIKPDNIMIRHDRLVKVLDFGLAKLVEQRGEIHRTDPEAKTRAQVKTNPGAVMGTADYMSPEQARGKKTDARTDIFSLGVVLYEMITGQKPFTGETVNHTIVNILEKEPPPVSAFAKDCPAELERIIQKTLAKNADERYGAAKDLLVILKRLQKRLEFEAVIQEGTKERRREREKDTLLLNVSPSQMPPNNLTENLSPLVGREKEIAEISSLLRQNDVRLLTLTGIGGTGKTRLAQTIARRVLTEFADGVFFVNLSAINDSKLVVSTIAQTLGVKEAGGESLLEALKNHLGERHLLLVVDNFEQVLEAAPDIAALLAAGNLKILITSRELLRLKAENEYPVPALTVPSEGARISFAELSNYEAIRFFVERARFAQPDFWLTEENADVVAEICRRLDGLPLAIELAAARVKIFAPQAIRKRLENSLKLLTGGAKDLPERRQTMRGAIAWSYDLLNDDEKKLLNRLAVFAGGFTLDGAEAIWSAEEDSGIDIFDETSSLLDKSLIVRRDQTDGEPRFRMLVVVREFAFEKLAKSGEAEQIKRLHTFFYDAFSEKANLELDGANAAEWYEKLEHEHDNIRAALEWTLDNEPTTALRIAVANYSFWVRRGYFAEGGKWMTEALKKSREDVDPKLRAEVHRKAAYLLRQQGDFEAAKLFGKEGLRLCRQIGDKTLISFALGGLGVIESGAGDFKSARKLVEESLAISKELNDQKYIGHWLNSLGEIARGEEDYRAARRYYEEALTINKQISTSNSHYNIVNLAFITYLSEDYQSSRSYSLEALEISEQIGNKVIIASATDVLAALALKAGKMEKAARLAGAAAAIYESIDFKLDKVDQKFVARYVEEARSAIGSEAFDAEYAKGRKLSMTDAIALAREGESKRQSGQIISMANAPPNNLSGELLPLIGRDAETAEIMDLLRQPDVRLLTITGVGGTGKTQLAQAIARESLAEFADGVHFVVLAPIDNHELVAPIIGQTLGVREEAGKTLKECLLDYLSEKKTLIVLDNFEQITKAAPLVGELLAGSPDLKILVTSRVRLNLKLEREFKLQPLGVPSDERITANELGKYPAVELFVKRAKAAKSDFALTEENAASVAEICRRLDGLPLAIELAAARVKLLAPQAIGKRLENSLNLLTGGAKDLPERQRTMRGAIAWSYDLLDAEEKKLLNRLSVFRGGLTLEGAEAIGNAQADLSVDLLDVFSSLVDKSLLNQREQADGEPRFRMLVVVREFAFEKLAESGEVEQIKRRHAEFYALLPDLLKARDATRWLVTLEREHDNMRAALEWSLVGEPETALRIVGAMGIFWIQRGHLSEGNKWAKQALEKNGEDADPKLRAKAYFGLGFRSRLQGDLEAAELFLEKSLRLAQEIGDKYEISSSLGGLATLKKDQGDLIQARGLCEESLAIARELNDSRLIALRLNTLGEIARMQENYQAAREFYKEALTIEREESLKYLIPSVTNNLASVACLQGDYNSALSYALESLKVSEELKDKISIGIALNIFAASAVAAGEMEKAARFCGAAQAIFDAKGYKLEKVDREFLDRYIKKARARVGDETFEAAQVEGRGMPLHEAIASARENESDWKSAAAAHITGGSRSGATSFQDAADATGEPQADVSSVSEAHGVSSAEYIAGEVKKHKMGAGVAAALLALIVAGIGYVIYTLTAATERDKPALSFQTAKFTRLTTTGKASGVAISPDGKYVVHIEDDGGRQSLWTRQVATQSNVQIVAPAAASYSGLTFSPDGNYIYYTAFSQELAQVVLFQVPTLGGTPKKLLENVATSPVTFSPDGKQFAFVRPTPREEFTLMIANADGTEERKIVQYQNPPEAISAPAWSPDGKKIAYRLGNFESNDSSVFETQIADGSTKPLTAQKWLGIGGLTWLADGSGLLMLATTGQQFVYQIWHLSYPEGEARQLTNDLNNYLGMSLAADSGTLAVVQSEQQASIWVAPTSDSSRARPVTSGSGKADTSLAWTPDGRIVYQSNAGGNNIWITGADGASAKQLTANARINLLPEVSPDGRYVVFLSYRTGVPHLWWMNIDGSDQRQLTNGASGEASARFSPDGRWLVYRTALGRWTVWKMPADGSGEPVQLTDKYSRSPTVSPDGKLIAYFYREDNGPWRIAVAPFEGGEPSRTFDIPALPNPSLHWTPDGRAVAYVDTQGGVSNIVTQPLDGGKPKQLTDFKQERIFSFDYSRNGKQLALSRGTINNDVVLISNFK